MKNKWIVSALLVSIVLPATTVIAQSSGATDESQEVAFMPTPEKQFDNPSLKLSNEQKEKIKKIFENNKPDMKKIRKEVWDKMKSLQEVYINDKKKEEDVSKAQDELAGAHKKAMDQHFKIMIQIRSILTSEQRKQFFENMKHWKNKKRNIE
jgi:Spy/CpxP family protein refolding chaperone